MAQAFNLTAQLNLQGPANIGRIVSDIKKQIGSIEGEVKFKVDAATAKNIAQLNSSLQSFNTTLSNTTSIASNAARALSDLRSAIGGINARSVSSDIKAAATATEALSKAASKASKDVGSSKTELEEFGRQSALAIRRFTAFTVVSGIMFKVSNSINQGLVAAIDFERQMVRLEQITGKSQQGLSSLSDTISNLSTSLGVSSASLINIADTLAQAGLSARDTEVALKALALTELAPSFDSLNETVEGSIALMRQFEISASELQGALGSINSVAARFAVESSDLITAIQRTGGVFATASKGVSEGTSALNEFLAVFTSVRATTRESAETIATGLRTIFTRIQREDTIEALEAYGVQLTDVEGKFIGAYRAVEQLSRGLSKLDPRSIEFSTIVEELGGFRQIGKVIPLIQQFSVAQEALKVAQTGQDSLAYDAVTAQKSLANQIVKVREEFSSLIREIGRSDAFQSLARGALSFASALISITDTLKGVLPILAIIGIRKGVSAVTQFGKGFIGGLKKVSSNNESEGIAGRVGRNAGETISGAKSERESRSATEVTSALQNATNSISNLVSTINSNINILQSNTNSLISNTASIDALTLAINSQSGPAGLNTGGRILGFAKGGSVPGSGDRDSVPAMLTPGEFVLNKKAVKSLGRNNLQRLNIGGKPSASIETLRKRKDNGARITSFKDNSDNYIEDDDRVSANIIRKKLEDYNFSPTDYDIITTELKSQGVQFPIGPQGSSRGKFDARSGNIIENLLIQKMGNGAKKYEGAKEYSDITNAPIDIIQGQDVYEVKFKSGRTSNNEILGKFLSYKLENLPYKSVEFTEDNTNPLSIDKVSLGTINLVGASNEPGQQGYKSAYIDYLKGKGEYALAKGGKVQKFAGGGVAQRKVGYIDYDVIANEANKNIVEKAMQETGQTGPRLYTDYLTQLAVKARKESSLQKLRAIYGVAGSGKTTLARGQGTDQASLRETTRFPILTPDDIKKATEVLILSSSVSKDKLDDVFAEADRVYTLSSTTKEEKERVRSQRASRDETGVGLEGRKPGVTASASYDTAVGEALLSDKLGDRSVVLGRSQSGRLRRKSGNELVEIVKKKIGFTWGGFAPMTAGHESIMDAAQAKGISPEDFIYLVGANEAIKAEDPSSYRTAIFDQDIRMILAKAGAGAKGATVLAKPRDFEVPQAFDITEEGAARRKVLVPGKGSMAFVADKTEEQTQKYKEAGYGVANIERTGGISGTMVRDLIMSGDLAKLQEVLSPGVYELISNNIGRLQNRANALPAIIEQVKSIQGGKLSDVESQIKALGISRIDNKKAASDPEYAAKVEVLKELRDKRDKIKSAAGFEPYRLLQDLARSQPDKYGLDFSTGSSDIKSIRTVSGKTQKANIGGLIRKFADAGEVEVESGKALSRAEILSVLGISGAAKAANTSTDNARNLLGLRRPLTPSEQAMREAIEKEYIKKINRQAGAAQATVTKLQSRGLEFGAAGLFGTVSPSTNLDIKSDRLSRSAKVRVVSGVMDQNIAEQLDQLFVSGTEDLAQRAAGIVTGGGTFTGQTISNPKAEASMQGGLLEKTIQLLGGPGSVQGMGFDFPDGLQGAARYFNLPPDIPTDLKRTLSGPSTIKENIITYLKNVMGYAGGGKVDYYSLEKNSGLRAREFDQLAQYAKINDFSLDEFQQYLKQRLSYKNQNAQLMMNPTSLLRAITPEPPTTADKQRALAEQLKGEPDAGYRPILTEAQRIAANRSAIRSSALEDINNATRFAAGGPVSLYHGSNTGVNDSVLESFKKQGARSDIAQGYGQGAGFYMYTEKNRAVSQAKMRVGGGGNFVLAQGDTAGKPMVLTFNETLDPATYDLDYELQKGLVVDWLYKNYSILKDKIAPKLTTQERYAGVLGVVDKNLDQGIMSSGIRVQGDTGSRKTIYSGTESDIREGELVGQIMNRLQANDPEIVHAFESELFKAPLGLVLKYVGSSPLKPKNIETFARGGDVAGFATGGYVPALVSNGEAYVPPKLAKKIGYGKLNRMNQADRNGIGRFADGGISIFKGPGTGTSDSIPANLPVGSFILRAKATKALGFNKGGTVGQKIYRFQDGGGVPKPNPADIKDINVGAKSLTKAAGDLTSAIDYVKSQIIAAAKQAAAETYKSQKSGGATSKEAIDAARSAAIEAARQKDKDIYRDRATMLKGFKVNPDDVFRTRAKLNKADLTSLRPQDLGGGVGLGPTNPIYAQTPSQIKAESNAASEARAKAAAEQRALADQAAAKNSVLFSLAIGGLGGIIQKVTKQMEGLGGVIGNVAARAGTRIGVAREASTTLRSRETIRGLNAFGEKTGINQLLSKVGFGPLGSQVAFATKALGGWASAIYVGMGIVKDFYNGIIEAEKKLTADNIQRSTDRISNLFDKMGREIEKSGSIDAINNELNNLAMSLNRQSELMRKGEMGFLNFFDILGSMAFGGDTEERANQRALILQQQGIGSYLASSLDFTGKTQQENYAKLAPKMVQQRAEENKVFVDNLNRLLPERLKRGDTGSDIMSELGTSAAPSLRARAIATQDTETQLTIERIRGSGASQEEKNRQIAALEFEAARSILSAQIKAEEAKIISDRLNKISQDFVTSITRLMSSMDQAINKTTFELQQLSNSAKLSRDSLGGKAGAGQVNLQSINVLRNPMAYGAEDRRSAARIGSTPFGIDAKLTEGLLTLPYELETSMNRAINETIAKDRASGEKKISTKVEQAAIDVIRQMDLGQNIESLLIQQTRGAFEQSRSKGEDKIGFRELAERIPALSKQIDAANRAQESAIRALELWQTVLNSYSEAMNRQVQDQIDINNYLRKASDIRTKGEMALSDALGKEVSLRSRVNASLSNVQSMTGGEINPAAISANVLDLENTRRAEQQAIDAMANSSIGVTDNFQLMNQKLASTNLALRENYAALENLSNSSDIASAALSKVQEISSKIKAGETFIEKLVTSSPAEINKLNRSFGLLSNNLQGMANTGTSAEERSQTLQLFNMISPLLGGGQKQNELRANVLQSMLQESGIGMDANLSSLIEAIRSPESLTEMQQAIEVYKSGVELQAAANAELGLIKEALKQNDLTIANQQLIDGFGNVMKNYQENQLNAIAANTRETADALKNGVPAPTKSSGGIIYASKGQAIFKPKGSDTVPAMLTPGEFVVNKSATSKNLPLLQSINNGYANGGKVSYYADGGAVAPFGKTVSSDETIWKPGRLQNITAETRTTSGQTSDYKYPTASYLAKLLAPTIYSTVVPNETVYGMPGQGNFINYQELRNEAEKELGFLNNFGILPNATNSLNKDLEKYSGNSYDMVKTFSNALSGTTELAQYMPEYINFGTGRKITTEPLPLLDQATNFEIEKNNLKSFDYIPAVEKKKYEKLLENIKANDLQQLKNIRDEYKNKIITNIDDYRKFKLELPNPNAQISAELTSLTPPRDMTFRIADLTQPLNTDKRIGVYPSTIDPSNFYSDNVGIGFDKQASVVSGTSRFGTTSIKGYIADDASFSGKTNKLQLLDDNFKLADSLESLYNQFNKDKFSKDTENLAARKNFTRKLLALYNNSSNYIDLSEDEFADMEIDKGNDVRKAASLSKNSIFPIRFYASNNNIPLQKDINIKQTISDIYGEDFANYIYDNNGLKTQKLKLANVSGDIGSIKTFSGWIPSALVDKIVSGDIKSFIGQRTSPVKKTTRSYNDPDGVLSFNYNEIEPDSLSYNEIARRFDEQIKLSDKFERSLVNGKLLTIDKDSTFGDNNSFNNMFGSNKQLIIKNSVSDLVSRIKSAFSLAADPNKPDQLIDQTLASLAENPDVKDYVGLDQLMLTKFALTGSTSKEQLSFSEKFIKSYSDAIASKEAKRVKTAAGAVSQDLVTKEIDPSFDEARRTTLARVAYQLANSQGLNLTKNPENIQDIENIRAILNSRVGNINNPNSSESIRLEAWNRLFTEISGTAEAGKGRSVVLAGAGIDIKSISNGGIPKTIPDPAIKGGNKTMYWDNITQAQSFQTMLENLLTRQIQVFRARRLGADSSLSADVADKARASLQNGIFVKTTPSPDGKGMMRTIDNQEAVLGNYADIFRYALTPTNIFSNSEARGILIDQLKNYYENAQGRGGELIFERDYVAKVKTSLDALKSWYSDQDFLLNTGANLQENIANYDKIVADRKMIEKYTGGVAESNPVVANTLLTNNQYGRLPYPDKIQNNNLFDLMSASVGEINKIQTQNRASGGLIYASNGSLIDFQPKGTDTVPAMLTPGEFVVNRQSTRNNLPLLKSINKNKGGKVSYYKDGGMVDGGSELDPKNSQGTKFLGNIDASTKTSSVILLEILRLINSMEQKMSNLGGGNNKATIRNWHGQNQQNMPETVSLPTVATQAPPIPAPLPVPRPPINPDMGESPEDTGPVTLGPPEMPTPEIVVPDMPDLEPILPSIEDLMARIDMPTIPPPEEGWSFDYETPFPQKVKIPEVPTPAIPSRNTPMQDVENRLGVMTQEQDQAYFDEEYRAAQDRKRERDETTNRNVAIGLRTVNDIMGPKGAIENIGNLFGGESTVEQVEGGLGLTSNIASIVANLAPEDFTRGKVSGKVGAGANALKDSMETVSALMGGDYAVAAENALGTVGDITSLLPGEALGVTGDVLGLSKNVLTFSQGLMNGEIDAQSGFGVIENAMSIGSQVGPYTTQFQAGSRYLGPAGAALEVGRGSYAGVMQAKSNDPRELALAASIGGATGDYELGGSSTAESLNKMGLNIQQGGTLDMGLEYAETLARGATTGFQAYGPAGAIGGLGVAVGGQALKMGAAVYNDQAMVAEGQAKIDQTLERSKTNNKSMSDPTYGLDTFESIYVKNIANARVELERLQKLQDTIGTEGSVGQGIGELVSRQKLTLQNEEQGLQSLATQRANEQTTTLFELGPNSPEVKAKIDEYNRRIAQSIDQLGNSMSEDIDPKNLPALSDSLEPTIANVVNQPNQQYYRPDQSYPIYNKRGGLIYANNGALINFQPKGSDTVPAMLTPGEFVINKDSTQKHLGLLRAINSGEYSHGGLVNYLKSGGLLLPNYYQNGARVGPNSAGMSFDISTFMNKIIGQITSSITTAFQNVEDNLQNRTAATGGVSTNIEASMSTIDQFVSRLDRIANTLKDLEIPPEIKIVGQHDINVVINGDAVLNQLKPELASLVMNSIKNAFQQFKSNNSAWQDSFNFDIT